MHAKSLAHSQMHNRCSVSSDSNFHCFSGGNFVSKSADSETRVPVTTHSSFVILVKLIHCSLA